MASLLGRILGISNCLLPPRKPLRTLSMCSPSSYTPVRKDGWEFSALIHGPSDDIWFPDCGLELPVSYGNLDLNIKHLDSSITFHFSPYDQLYKWIKEKETRNPLASDLPSYNSPLLAFAEDMYDSAYVGRVLIEKPSEESIDPIWENVDQKTLDEQIVWMTKNEHVSGVPHRTSLSLQPYRGAKQFEEKGLVDPLINYTLIWYNEGFTYEEGAGCFLYLVVTDFGWFVYLEQTYQPHEYGPKRSREMSMHCSFKHDIIYREIIERQSEDFEERMSKHLIPSIHGYDDIHNDKPKKQDDKMFVHFHEAKQLRIQEADIRGVCKSLTVHDADRYSSFTVGEQNRKAMGIRDVRTYAEHDLKTTPPVDSPKPLKELSVPDSVIESLFTSGKPMQLIEEKFGNCIQVLPCFRHPYNPRSPSTWSRLPRQAPRKAYILSSEATEEYIKSASSNLSNLANSIDGTRR